MDGNNPHLSDLDSASLLRTASGANPAPGPAGAAVAVNPGIMRGNPGKVFLGTTYLFSFLESRTSFYFFFWMRKMSKK